MEKITLKTRKLRELYGHSQAAIAFHLGISQAAYCKKESGQTQFTIECLEKLADIYQLTTTDLLNSPVQDLLIQALRSSASQGRRL